MKRKINCRFICLHLSALILLFLSVADSFAQLRADYGPKVGPNVSIFRSNMFFGNEMPFDGMVKPKFGFSLGAFLNLRFAKARSFQFEANIMYTTRGNRSDYINFEIADDAVQRGGNISEANQIKSFRVSYLEFPLLFKYSGFSKGNIRPFLMAGPTYSGIWSAKYTANTLEAKDVKNDLYRDDFGVTLGGGVSWFYLDRWYFLDLRYFHGIINASDRFNENLDPYNYLLEADEIRKNIPSLKNNGNFFNSTLSVTFGVSLSRQIKTFQ